jgi:hypothetical protein
MIHTRESSKASRKEIWPTGMDSDLRMGQAKCCVIPGRNSKVEVSGVFLDAARLQLLSLPFYERAFF